MVFINPQFGYCVNDVKGYIPEVYYINGETSETHYNNDRLMGILLATKPEFYSKFLKYFGAIGPRNRATYFESEDDCKAFLEILEYIYNEIVSSHRSWYEVSQEVIKQLESEESDSSSSGSGNTSEGDSLSENREDYYLSNEKTYRNLESYQGIPKDINYTKKDSKDMNMGHITEDPFKPGQSKKPPHYTIL